MQVAVFSDAHGNLTAMQAVLADIEKQRPDYTLFAGDLCLFGARPTETLRLLRENGIHDAGETRSTLALFKGRIHQTSLPSEVETYLTGRWVSNRVVMHVNERKEI